MQLRLIPSHVYCRIWRDRLAFMRLEPEEAGDSLDAPPHVEVEPDEAAIVSETVVEASSPVMSDTVGEVIVQPSQPNVAEVTVVHVDPSPMVKDSLVDLPQSPAGDVSVPASSLFEPIVSQEPPQLDAPESAVVTSGPLPVMPVEATVTASDVSSNAPSASLPEKSQVDDVAVGPATVVNEASNVLVASGDLGSDVPVPGDAATTSSVAVDGNRPNDDGIQAGPAADSSPASVASDDNATSALITTDDVVPSIDVSSVDVKPIVDSLDDVQSAVALVDDPAKPAPVTDDEFSVAVVHTVAPQAQESSSNEESLVSTIVADAAPPVPPAVDSDTDSKAPDGPQIQQSVNVDEPVVSGGVDTVLVPLEPANVTVLVSSNDDAVDPGAVVAADSNTSEPQLPQPAVDPLSPVPPPPASPPAAHADDSSLRNKYMDAMDLLESARKKILELLSFAEGTIASPSQPLFKYV